MGEQSTTLPRWASFGVTAQAAPRGLPGPVVVGGVGGSGTRVIAHMMKMMGFYMGAFLNTPEDNLWFNALFGRPRWLASATAQDITRALTIFDQAMHDDLSLANLSNVLYVVRAVLESGPTNPNPDAPPRTLRARVETHIRTIASLLRITRRVDLSKFRAWGWKLPRTHAMLSALADFYPSMKYILVVRHGLDMAFSRNQIQAGNWSWLYGLPEPSYPISPAASLAYWVRATEASISVGKAKLGDRFMALHFDALCTSPEQEVDKLIRFIGLDVPRETREALVMIPTKPDSAGRYRQHDLNQLDPADVEAVRRLGFEVDS